MVRPHTKDLVRYIYALIDPRNNAVRCIGCAGDIDKRLQEHMRNKNLDAPKYQWLAELKQFGCGWTHNWHGSLEATSDLDSPHPQA